MEYYEKTDRSISFKVKILALFLNALLIVDLLRMIPLVTGRMVSVVQYFLYILIALCTYYDIVVGKKGLIEKKLFGFIAISLVVIIVSVFVCPDVISGYGYFIPFFITRIIPAMIFMIYSNQRVIQDCVEQMKKYRFIWIVYAVIGNIWIPQHTASWNQYSMTYGYNLLIPACLLWFYFVLEKRIKWIAYDGIIVMLMVLRGSRASVLCLFIFMVLVYIFVDSEKHNTGRQVRIVVALSLLGVTAVSFQSIVSVLVKLLSNSRTLYLLSTNISFDSGRSGIMDFYWEEINNHLFSFKGILSDRVIYSQKFGTGFSLTNYPHNFIIEVLFQFGVIIGILFLLFLLSLLLKKFKEIRICSNPYYTCFYFMLFVAGLIKLFFSASYLTSVEFFLLLGMLLVPPFSLNSEEDFI